MCVFVGRDDDEIEPDRALEGPPNVEVALGASQIGLSDNRNIEIATETDRSSGELILKRVCRARYRPVKSTRKRYFPGRVTQPIRAGTNVLP